MELLGSVMFPMAQNWNTQMMKVIDLWQSSPALSHYPEDTAEGNMLSSIQHLLTVLYSIPAPLNWDDLMENDHQMDGSAPNPRVVRLEREGALIRLLCRELYRPTVGKQDGSVPPIILITRR